MSILWRLKLAGYLEDAIQRIYIRWEV
jgi:hypothetical protein